MPATHRLTANFTQALGKELPTIPGLLTLAYFGSGYDGINSNRATGPALANLGGTAPSYQSNYAVVGGASPYSAIDTQNLRNAAMVASGWTWATVARQSGAGNSIFIGDWNPSGSTQAMVFYGAATSAILYNAGAKATLPLAQNVSNFHFYAVTYTGGALGTWTLYEFTENQSGASATWVQTANITAQNNSPHFGNTTNDASFVGVTNTAFGMVASGVMSQPSLAALAAAVRPWLARRGITC